MSINDQRWKAIKISDVKAAGAFVYGRESDQIYHSPICRNRPSPDEIRFFDTPEAARQQGIKACNDCYPDQAVWLVGVSRWMKRPSAKGSKPPCV